MKKIEETKEKLKTYKFRDELGHPLENCIDYQELIAELERLEKENNKIQRVVECAKELLHHRFVLGTTKYPKTNTLWENLQQALAE